MVEGVGLVVAGIVKSGTAKTNMHCLLGPNKARGFRPVIIKSIHVNRSSRDEAVSG
jgi:GTPase